MSTYLTPILIAAAVVIGVGGQFLLKAGMDAVGRVDSLGQLFSGPFLLRMVSTWQVPVALVLYAFGAFLWMAVLSRENVSWAYPFLGLTYVLVLVGGALIFKEPVTPAQIGGTLLVALGVLLVARS